MRKTMLVATALLLAGQAAAAPSFRYEVVSVTLTDLGFLGGRRSWAWDINNAGSIVGWAETPAGLKHAFLYRAGIMGDVGVARPTSPSEARGINNSDTLVGFWDSGAGVKAFRWTAGGFFPLNDRDPPPGSATITSSARAINDAGRIAGQRTYLDWGYSEATVWQDDSLFDPLHRYIFPYTSNVNDISGSDYAVGRERETPATRRWRWSYSGGAGSASVIVPKPPGAGYGDNDALGVNRIGEVAGSVFCCRTGTRYLLHAFYWNGVGPEAVDLGTRVGGSNSVAEDINSAAFIAGYADRLEPVPPPATPTLVDAAFIHHRDFGMYVLPKPAYTGALRPCRAYALNERLTTGLLQVVGMCEGVAGSRAVRWNVNIARREIPPGTTP